MGALAAVCARLPRRAAAQSAASSESLASPDVVQALAFRAVEAARDAGATYADVRLTRTVTQAFNRNIDRELYGIGVRAYAHGTWGFSASAVWTPDEAARLARDAVAQATLNPRSIDADVPLCAAVPMTGTWTMPIQLDPFAVSYEERLDTIASWVHFAASARRPHVTAQEVRAVWSRQEQALATTEGTYISQVTYQVGGAFVLRVVNLDSKYRARIPWVDIGARGLEMAGAGWEHLRDANIREQIPSMIAEAEERMVLYRTAKPAEGGRYDVVCDAATAGRVIDATVGKATELDRAIGYEANARGTSYLGPDPLVWLGAAPIAASCVTVRAAVALSKGLANVRWDAEGVEPREFPLVQEGVLVDYQTTRALAPRLAAWYARHGVPVQSRGCAAAESAQTITMQHRPNLALQPGRDALSFDDMVANTKRGIAIMDGSVRTDFQAKNGVCRGYMREIVNGKLANVIVESQSAFSTAALLRSVSAVGGAASAVSVAGEETKGQPEQTMLHTVSAVPIMIHDLPVSYGVGA